MSDSHAPPGSLADDLLLAALRETPRPFLLPTLPPDTEAARSQGGEAALAFAMETARADPDLATRDQALRMLFTSALANLIARAVAPGQGDPAFQAQVLRSQLAVVDEFVALAESQARDVRTVRSQVDAIAHPGKLRGTADAVLREQRLRLHELATARAWAALADTARDLVARAPSDAPWRDAAARIAGDPALLRLGRFEALQRDAAVQRYAALRERTGAQAGSEAAADRGRDAANVGDAAEHETGAAFAAIARLLDEAAPASAPHRVARSLRTPAGFQGGAPRTKDEWDVAIVRDGHAGAHILLLAEVKAAPSSAATDLPQLLRGLQRLAQADPGASYAFPSPQGDVRLSGATLRALQPQGRVLPAHVVYCCPAAGETRPAILGAAARSLLLAEPASIAFAREILDGQRPAEQALDAVWEAVLSAPRLRPALEQDATARAARAAMLRPRDLLATMERHCGRLASC